MSCAFSAQWCCERITQCAVRCAHSALGYHYLRFQRAPPWNFVKFSNQISFKFLAQATLSFFRYAPVTENNYFCQRFRNARNIKNH